MFRAELLGLVTTTATKVSATVALVGLIVTQLMFVTVLPALARGDIGPGAAELGADLPALDLTSAAVQLSAINPLGASMGGGSVGVALLAIVLLGVLAGTSDDRYGGIVGAVLASPRRGRIVIAKAAAAGAAGLVVGAMMAVASLATLLGTLVVAGIPLTAGAGGILGALGRGALVTACLLVIGLAVGILTRTQLAGVITILAIVFVEPIIMAITQLISGGVGSVWTQFLPVTLAHTVIAGGSDGTNLVIATAALIAITAGALGAASLALARRDI